MKQASQVMYRVLIVGCGNIAGGFDYAKKGDFWPLTHAGGYTRHGGFIITGCIDSDETTLKYFANYWNIHIAAKDFLELRSEAGTYDVISICSPTQFREEHLEEALRLRPRVILCEKPLTNGDVIAASRFVSQCKSQGTLLVVNYSRNWDPSIAELINDLNKGLWGAIRSVVGHYNKGILNNGGHMFDLLFRMLGPLELIAATQPSYDFWSDDPTLGVLLTAKEGLVPVYLNPTNASDYSYFELELICELGVIRMQSGGMSWQLRSVETSQQYSGYKTLGVPKSFEGRYVEAMAGIVDEVYQYLQNGAETQSGGDNALKVQLLCNQIKQMAQEKYN